MTGQELKSKLNVLGLSEAEIARRLGKPQQSFNQTLKAQDVKTSLLEELCKTFNVDMSFFYQEDFNKAHVVQSINGNNSNNVNTEIGSDYKEMIEKLLEQNDTLIKSNDTLMKSIVGLLNDRTK